MKRWYGCCCVVAIVVANGQAIALPPFGLTQISSSPVPLSKLELIGDSAYISGPTGVWGIDSSGAKSFAGISHPSFGAPTIVTRPVEGLNEEIYVATNFGSFGNPTGSALFALSDLSTPVMTWTGYYWLGGVDRESIAYGNSSNPPYRASRLLTDGTVEPLGRPPGSNSNNSFTHVFESTPSGYARGQAGVPDTIGDAPAFWTPDGSFSFVETIETAGVSYSIRDRADGDSVNIGLVVGGPTVKYGGQAAIEILSQVGTRLPATSVLVSHGDFVVIDHSFRELHGFYPGIIPDHADRALPILDIFPELASIDLDEVTDLASVDGYLYMTLSGDDGLYLFGARDPSVVPEPGTLALAILGIVAVYRKFLFQKFTPPLSGTA